MAENLLIFNSLSIGILLPASLVFAMSLRRHLTPYHLSFFLISLAGLLLNASEGSTVFFGMIIGNPEAAVLGNRIMEIVITSLIFIMPLHLLGIIDNTKQKRPFYIKYMVILGAVVALFFILVQIFAPDLFKSTTIFASERAAYGLGRGIPGPMMLYRDLSLFMSILVLLGHYVYFAFNSKDQRIQTYVLLAAAFLPILGGLDDLYFNFYRRYFLLPGLDFPRFIPMLTVYITISLGMSFYAFVKQSNAYQLANQELQESRDKLDYLAFYDRLTGLPNQKAFFERLDTEILNTKRTGELQALLIIDIDDFKAYNDAYGFAVGDQVIQKSASYLREISRESDFLARISGDEMGMIITGLEHPTQAALLAQKLMSINSQKLTIGEKEYYATVSIGIALFPGDSLNRIELLRMADEALFEAKKDKNTFQFYTPSTNVEAHNRLSILNDLRQAVDQGDFELHYQPMVDRQGRIIGAEALLRWKRKDGNYLGPNIFIPIAESTGLIQGLGLWVIEKAMNDSKALKEIQKDLFVSINLSAKQLRNPHLPSVISDNLSHNGLSKNDIHLEITETALMENHNRLQPILNEFEVNGLHMSIDDFGVGYSSLSNLRNLPVSTLKIDRAFIENMSNGAKDKAIVQSVIDLAKGLELWVVAEGAETNLQVNQLWEMGCDIIQGYFYYKPMPKEQLLELLIAQAKEQVP
jgi:diguanylate cyclase (GGDEF)-like protein